eukprot:3932152-Rhodomonas_salina.1
MKPAPMVTRNAVTPVACAPRDRTQYCPLPSTARCLVLYAAWYCMLRGTAGCSSMPALSAAGMYSSIRQLSTAYRHARRTTAAYRISAPDIA